MSNEDSDCTSREIVWLLIFLAILKNHCLGYILQIFFQKKFYNLHVLIILAW